MLNTKCEKCLFANPVSDTSLSQCSQNIIDQIKSHKTILQEDNFNVIQEYACRYGFAKEVYDQNKENLKDINLLDHINQNAQIKYYLLLDIQPETNISDVMDTINNIACPPQFISLMFRSPDIRKFSKEDQSILNNKSQIEWKCHNFTHYLDLQEGIDHILSTNMGNSKSSHFLVYSPSEMDTLSEDIIKINETIVLYQKPQIAMLKNKNSLYGLFISFENYKVAKSFGKDILETLKDESEVLEF